MGQEGSKRKRNVNIPLDKDTLILLRNLKEKTKFNEDEIQKLYTCFEQHTGDKQVLNRMDFQKILGELKEYNLDQFKNLPLGYYLFDIIDTNNNGLIDLSEFFIGMSPICKGTQDEKIDLTFQIFDRDKNGFITQDEIKEMYISTYSALMKSLRNTLTPPEFVDNPEANKFQDELVKNLQNKFEDIMQGVSKNIMQELDRTGDGTLSKIEFKDFVLAYPFVKASYQLKFTKDGDEAYQDDEKLTTEVPLSFLVQSNDNL